MSLELTFQIEMQSDYHVGAGYGKGTEVDSALLRDADGVPVLRGTVLNGLLRDALWRLLQRAPLEDLRDCQASGLSEEETSDRYCGQHAGDDFEPCPICRLFGTPRTMKRWRIGSARPEDMGKLARTDYEDREIASQRVARVRVNPRTRRAAPHKLFAEEQGGQLTFTFTVSCPADPARDESALDEAALLVAAARFVRQLGRSRRRGQGQCLVSLTGIEGMALGGDPQEALLERFEEHWLEGEPGTWALQGIPLERTREAPDEGEPLRLRVLARLDEPLIIAQRAAAGNRFRTQPLIPGKTLRGALAARAAERFDLEDEATYDAFVDLFLRGGVDFPVLYPLRRVNGSFYPAAPLPRDGFGCKVYRDHPVQWGTQKGQIQECAKCGNPVKGVRGAFSSLREEPERFEPETRSEMHIRVDPQSGRVAEGQLFEYEALEAGQYFAGELTCADEEAWELLQTLASLEEEADVELRLGKATRRGYGKVTLWLEMWGDEKPPVWIQQPLAERVDEGADELTLTLLTDAIVTDAWGRFVTGFDSEWLSEALGFEVRVVEGRDFAATHRLDGFNTQLRLPRWRDVALRAGSTARLKVMEEPKGGLLEALARIERKGIGRRRNEGYGRVAFDHPLYDAQETLTDTQVTIPQAIDLAMRETTEESARMGFREDWRKALEDTSWDSCRDPAFAGLARWLDAHRHEPIDELLEKMSAVGEPDAQLIERLGGAEERGDREIANRLTDKDGFTEVEKLLRRLEEKEEAHWPLGVRMLADRLAEAAEREEGGR